MMAEIPEKKNHSYSRSLSTKGLLEKP